MPEGHLHNPNALDSLGCLLTHCFRCTEELVNIDNAITALNNAVQLTSEDDSSKTQSGELIDLEKAISAHTDAVHLTHANKPGNLNGLGNTLLEHFLQLGELVSLKKAISTHMNAVHLTHANKPSSLNGLGCSLTEHFKQIEQLIDIERAISAHEDALWVVMCRAQLGLGFTRLGLAKM
ncbi:hypothetical protein PILCRDRAFT_8823 [Piloderma croceum F 1598]|uniref:Anaphase-promoting complex subunit 5 domain-containing protein n=1 Tax=Piloderma croceum (strain F 1598) TaxID=765440 RepID=A0A0C3F9Y6_PILCF|nr:hypothetical protein PILCRDRAFT_8823 [Piloderma croceum F 1598]